MSPAWTARYVGIPFAEHGRDASGCDCWGLVRLVLTEQFGQQLPDLSADYAHTRDGAAISALYDAERESWRPVADARPGDVLVLRLEGAPAHVAVVVAPGTMLHVLKGLGAALERYDGPLWRHRVVACYRHR